MISESENQLSGQRFGRLQELETIRLAMPYHNEMQILVGRKVGDIIRNNIKADKKLLGDIKVVEIGTGKGFTTEEILKASPEIKVISADHDAGMVGQARAIMENYVNEGRLEIHEADAIEFLKRFSNDSVFLVASGFTIHNFQNQYRQKALEEIYRILRPGGEFITADKIMPDEEEVAQKEMQAQMGRFRNIPDEAIRQEWIKHYQEDMQPDIIMREKDLIKMFEGIGFRNISITDRKQLEALARAEK